MCLTSFSSVLFSLSSSSQYWLNAFQKSSSWINWYEIKFKTKKSTIQEYFNRKKKDSKGLIIWGKLSWVGLKCRVGSLHLTAVFFSTGLWRQNKKKENKWMNMHRYWGLLTWVGAIMMWKADQSWPRSFFHVKTIQN